MFLYFIPKHPRATVTRADFEALGLGYALGVGDPDARKCGSGPGGDEGVIAVPAPAGGVRGPASLYEPAKQTWRKGPGGKWFVGFYKDQRPTPASLRREKLIEGEPVTFRDGSEWLVPIARSIVRGTTLPKELVLGEDNETWQLTELEEYLGLCRDAEKVWGLFMAAEAEAAAESETADGKAAVTIDQQEGMRICISALAVNYRVGPAEVSMLRPTDGDMWSVLRAVCDVPAVERVLAEREKKTGESTAATSPTEGGPPATSAATCPPSGT